MSGLSLDAQIILIVIGFIYILLYIIDTVIAFYD